MEENIILELEREDGSKYLRLLVEFFKSYNGRTYAVLLPVNDDETIESDADYEIVRATPVTNENGLQDYEIESIPDEDEMNAVSEEIRVKWVTEMNDNDLTMNSDEPKDNYSIVEITDANGETFDCYIADVFEARGRNYAALFKVSDEQSDEKTYYLFRAEYKEQDGIEGVELSPIVSDMEFEDVNSLFKEERLPLL